MQKPYYRDVWALGPPNTGYPGAFPRGLIPKVKKKWWGNNIKRLSDSVEYWEKEKARFTSELKGAKK